MPQYRRLVGHRRLGPFEVAAASEHDEGRSHETEAEADRHRDEQAGDAGRK